MRPCLKKPRDLILFLTLSIHLMFSMSVSEARKRRLGIMVPKARLHESDLICGGRCPPQWGRTEGTFICNFQSPQTKGPSRWGANESMKWWGSLMAGVIHHLRHPSQLYRLHTQHQMELSPPCYRDPSHPPNVSRATKTTNHQSSVQEHSCTGTVSFLGDHTGWDPLESNWQSL